MLEAIFATLSRQRLCRFFVQHPDERFTSASLAKHLGRSSRAIAKDLRTLTESGVLVIQEGNYVFPRTFPLFGELESLFFKTALLLERRFIDALKGMGGLGLIVLTGRFVGTPAPVDLLLVGSVNRPVLEKILRFIEQQGVSINYTVLSRQAFQSRWSMTDRFLYGIFEGKHEILLDKWGLVSVPI